MEFWTLTNSSPTRAAAYAQRAEQAGWDGIMVVDSQNLSGDCYVALTAMAIATKGIQLGTGVTNPVTRHPAVTASAITAIQRLSGGRACLGIGRGDSALAHLGKAPAKVATLAQYLRVLQAYLKGDGVPFDLLDFSESVAPDVATLGLADTPDTSQLKWVSGQDIKVPVEVASTGPKVIETAAKHADRIMFALGADVDRLKWGVHTALETADRLGRYVELGAYVNVVCHDDVETARQLVQGSLSTFARFSIMHGQVAGTISKEQEKVLHALHTEYDMKSHTRTDSKQASVMPPEFIDQYAIVGSAEHCVARLEQLQSIGISKIVVIGPSAGSDREQAIAAENNLSLRVLTAFR